MKQLFILLLLLIGACPSKPYTPSDPKPTTAPTSNTASTQSTNESLPPGILARGDGSFGVVQVEERDGRRLLTIGGVVQGAISLQRETIQADPMVELLMTLRPSAKTALIIGLGTGQTAMQLAAKGVAVESVEIEPLVVEYAKRFFDFKGEVTVADGRKILETRQQQYDIVLMDATTGEDPPKELMKGSVVEMMRKRSTKEGVIAARLLAKPSDPEIRSYIKSLGSRFYASFGSGLGDERQNLYAFGSSAPFEFYHLSGMMLRPLSVVGYELPALGVQDGKVSVLGYLIELREDGSLALDLPHAEMGAIRFLLLGPEVAALKKLLPARVSFPTSGDLMSDGDTSKTLEPLLGGGGVKRSDVRFSPVIVVLEGTAKFRSAVDADRVFGGKLLDPERGPGTDMAKEVRLPYGGVLYELEVEKVAASYTQSSWKDLSAKVKPLLVKATNALKKGDTKTAEAALTEHQAKLKEGVGLIAEKLAYSRDISAILSDLQSGTATLTKTSTSFQRGVTCDRVAAAHSGDSLIWSNEDYRALFESLRLCAVFWYEKSISKGLVDEDAKTAGARLLDLYGYIDDGKKTSALQQKYPDLVSLEEVP